MSAGPDFCKVMNNKMKLAQLQQKHRGQKAKYRDVIYPMPKEEVVYFHKIEDDSDIF